MSKIPKSQITQRIAISWFLQLFLVMVAAATVWVYMARDHSLRNERRYYALSGALSQVGVAYWEKDIETGEYRFGENFASFLGLRETTNLPSASLFEAVLEFFRRWRPQPLGVDDWLEAVHPEDRDALEELLDKDEGSFSGNFRIRDFMGEGWRPVLVSGVVHGALMVGVCAAFPERPVPAGEMEQRKQLN